MIQYHVTPTSRITQILQEGLKPNENVAILKSGGCAHKGDLFFSPDYLLVVSYGYLLKEEDFYMLKVDVDGVNLIRHEHNGRLYPDEEYHTKDVVPPERILEIEYWNRMRTTSGGYRRRKQYSPPFQLEEETV